MIEDNNKSRVHLGLHWNFDCEFGSRSGVRIAEAAYRNAYTPYAPELASRREQPFVTMGKRRFISRADCAARRSRRRSCESGLQSSLAAARVSAPILTW